MTDSEHIAILEATNAELREQIKSLEEKVALLFELLQKQNVKKDSHNSHLPPSSDLSTKNKSLRSKSGRGSGAQPGHSGNTLEMSAHPDRMVELKSNFCGRCGSSLEGGIFTLQARRQVIEIPPIKPVVEEYRQYICQCPRCEHEQKADFPPRVKAPVQYGGSVEALATYFSVYQYLPYRRLRNLFEEVFNLPVSEGTLKNLLERAAVKSESVYERIRIEIEEAKAVGSDETSAQVNSRKWWIWVWQNVLNTLIVAADNRGRRAVEEVWPNGLPKATLSSDRWAAQLNFKAGAHQLCLAHLLRETIYLEEKEGHEFAGQFGSLLRKVFEAHQQMRERGQAYSIIEGKTLEDRLDHLLMITVTGEKYPETARLQKAMIKYRGYLLPCLYDIEIPPDNNGSERAIRNIKVKQKISGQFKSGQKTFCVLRSVIDTLLKRQLDVLTYLNHIMLLQPE